MLKAIVAWKLLRQLKEEDVKFSLSQLIAGWLEMGNNQVVMNQLNQWSKFNQEAVKMMLLLETDKKDIEKARLIGKLEVITAILEKVELAKNNKLKYERTNRTHDSRDLRTTQNIGSQSGVV